MLSFFSRLCYGYSKLRSFLHKRILHLNQQR
jgi:hypothetical protein